MRCSVSSVTSNYLYDVSSSTLLTIFGGRVNDLKPFLLEERLPDGWESRVRSRFGLTFLAFNTTVLPLEFSIKEGKASDAPAPAAAPATSSS